MHRDWYCMDLVTVYSRDFPSVKVRDRRFRVRVRTHQSTKDEERGYEIWLNSRSPYIAYNFHFWYCYHGWLWTLSRVLTVWVWMNIGIKSRPYENVHWVYKVILSFKLKIALLSSLQWVLHHQSGGIFESRWFLDLKSYRYIELGNYTAAAAAYLLRCFLFVLTVILTIRVGSKCCGN